MNFIILPFDKRVFCPLLFSMELLVLATEHVLLILTDSYRDDHSPYHQHTPATLIPLILALFA